jgi:hypothetical protein
VIVEAAACGACAACDTEALDMTVVSESVARESIVVSEAESTPPQIAAEAALPATAGAKLADTGVPELQPVEPATTTAVEPIAAVDSPSVSPEVAPAVALGDEPSPPPAAPESAAEPMDDADSAEQIIASASRGELAPAEPAMPEPTVPEPAAAEPFAVQPESPQRDSLEPTIDTLRPQPTPVTPAVRKANLFEEFEEESEPAAPAVPPSVEDDLFAPAQPAAEETAQPAGEETAQPAADETAQPAAEDTAEPFAVSEPEGPMEPATESETAPTAAEPAEDAAPEEPATDARETESDPFSDAHRQPVEPLRRWVDASGQHATVGVLVDVGGDAVEIRKANGRSVRVPLERLSRIDRAYAAEAGPRLAGRVPAPQPTETAGL